MSRFAFLVVLLLALAACSPSVPASANYPDKIAAERTGKDEMFRNAPKESPIKPGEFEKLQDEVHAGIKDDVRDDHVDGYRRVVAVVKTARSLPLAAHPLHTRIHVRDRGGICHQLANDGKVRWVK